MPDFLLRDPACFQDFLLEFFFLGVVRGYKLLIVQHGLLMQQLLLLELHLEESRPFAGLSYILVTFLQSFPEMAQL